MWRRAGAGSSTASTRGGSRPRCAGGPTPRHVGIILDGNRRWARAQGRDPVDAYRVGAAKLDEVLAWCVDLAIPAVTLWACSTENLGRAPDELRGLLSVIENKLNAIAGDPRVHRRRIRVRAVGKLDLLPDSTLAAIRRAEQATEGVRRRRAHVRPGLRRPAGDRRRRPAPRPRPRQAGRDVGRDRRRRDPGGDLALPVRPRPAGPRPDHQDVRGGAAVRASSSGRAPTASSTSATFTGPSSGRSISSAPSGATSSATGASARELRGAAGRRAAPRILILSAPYGAGHARAAEAVARAFAAEGAQVEVLDHFVQLPAARLRAEPRSRCSGASSASRRACGGSPTSSRRASVRGRRPWRAWIASAPRACCATWSGRARTRSCTSIRRPPAPWPRSGLAGRPGCRTASCSPTSARIRSGSTPAWSDTSCRPRRCARGSSPSGIAADRVVTSGLPVDASFMAPPDRPALRAAMGLAADVPVVLVTGGMRGLLRGVAEACEALASLDRPFVALAVCGDHLRLAARLRRRHGGTRASGSWAT